MTDTGCRCVPRNSQRLSCYLSNQYCMLHHATLICHSRTLSHLGDRQCVCSMLGQPSPLLPPALPMCPLPLSGQREGVQMPLSNHAFDAEPSHPSLVGHPRTLRDNFSRIRNGFRVDYRRGPVLPQARTAELSRVTRPAPGGTHTVDTTS